jgi:CRP-like cAMP-binding protein
MQESALVRKLGIIADLDADDRSRLNALCNDVRPIERRCDITSEGDRPEHIHLMIKGWAARYEMLPDGSRQIMDFLIPGDFCDLHATVLGHMDHGIVALTPCRVAHINPAAMDRLTVDNNRLARALLWSTLVDAGTLREWIVNIGRRAAYERIAHLLCEIHARVELIGLVENGRLALPVTQDELADATGLTAVHVNRTLQRLRSEGFIEIGQGMLQLVDVDKLQELAGFNPNYLHIERRIS